ncbi:hypothetical protein AFLA_000527 [Aspergillus flavus NRRL3357]|nr:hypothetical protein AFLA_000527 [Aspergillus flavus NRRL3357]
MAPASITLIVEPRGKPIKKLPKEIQINPNAPAQDIYAALAAASGSSIHRLRITKGSDRSVVPNSKETKVDDTGLKERSVVHVKDLGPQIGWRTVFIIEYFGPLVIPALFLYPLRPYIYYNFDKPLPEPSYLQQLVCALLSIHFLKREFETIFIHRFSNATMPARNIFKNSAHYWVLAGLNIAYWVFRPDASAVNEPNPALLYAGLGLFVFGELGQLELAFGATWPAPSGYHRQGGLSWSVLFFITVGGAQMAAWAKKKERRYRKEFGDKYKRKSFVMIPGLI